MKPGRVLWLLIAASLMLMFARGAAWEWRHDEGTTFDLAVGKVLINQFIHEWPARPVPISELYDVVENRTPYSLWDAVDSVELPYRMFHPPGYYGLLHMWTKVFGTGKLVMRLPSYLFTILALLGMARIARRVVPGANSALWVAALFALSPWVISVTNFARPYHLGLCLAIWSTVAALGMHETGPRFRWRLAFVLFSALGLYTIYHYAFVLAWQAALLALLSWREGREQRTRSLAALALSGAAIVALFSPWIRVLRVHMRASGKSGDYFIGAVAPGEWFTRAFKSLQDFALADSLYMYGGVWLRWLLPILGLATLVLAIWSFVGPARKALDGTARAFWLTAPVLPLLIILSDVMRDSHTIFITKLCFGFVPILLLLVVRAWLAAPWRALRVAGLTTWAAMLCLAVVFTTYSNAKKTNDNERVAALLAQADTDDHLVVISSDIRDFAVPFLLTLRDRGVKNIYVTRCHEPKLGNLVTSTGNAGIFNRLSLVNMKVTHTKKFMWGEEFLRGIAVSAKGAGWTVFWALHPAWTRGPLKVSTRVASKLKEMWMIGPVQARFFHGTF
jgi:hypothetical protein